MTWYVILGQGRQVSSGYARLGPVSLCYDIFGQVSPGY
jgi:hypothetical protein